MGIFESIKNAFGGKAEQEPKITVSPDRPLPGPGVQAEAVEQAPGADKSTALKEYTVQSGDTLWKISLDVYGDGSKHMKIFEANSDLLQSPDQIFPGQVLVIPEL